jgi:hypothetical protein
MSRPLIISDCDEVLLYMVVPFRDWVDSAHAIDFSLDNHDFSRALTYRHDGSFVEPAKVWNLLGGFFDEAMDRQPPIPGAVTAINKLSEIADIAILTNLQDHRAEARSEQLKAVGIDAPIFTNQGPKGDALARIKAEYQPSVTVFIDDMSGHHESVNEVSPDVWRLHMIGEPLMARHFEPAPFAHARIDHWDAAHIWIEEKLTAGAPAPKIELETV